MKVFSIYNEYISIKYFNFFKKKEPERGKNSLIDKD